MLRYLAPAGAPIRLVDLARWAGRSLGGGEPGAVLEQQLRTRYGVQRAFPIATGRAGMTLLLRAMRRLNPSRDEVVVPSYTCYSVAASVVKAGLRPRIVDISPETLDYAPEALAGADCSRVLAIVATNLYGTPCDLASISRLARSRGVFLIDDAAQAMGASVDGRWCGTWGDAGLFSFDKGKNVAAIDGGVVVTSAPALAAALDEEVAGLPAPSAGTSAGHLVKAVAYAVMLRPWLYGIPARLPQLGLGRTVFTTDFPLAQADRRLVALAATMMERLDWFTEARTANARRLLDGLTGIPGVRTFPVPGGVRAAYLRLPILFDRPETRNRAIAALNAAGIGATGSYPASLVDLTDLGDAVANPEETAPSGRRVAAAIATLPTHPFVTARDIARTLSIVGRVADAGLAAGPAASASAAIVSPRPH